MHVVIAGFVLCGATLSAFAYCSEPIAPSCATRYGAFDDQDDFERCKRQMSYFKSETESFLSCLQNDAETARSGYNNAVEAFNRRARG
jgi:hypothetical protein